MRNYLLPLVLLLGVPLFLVAQEESTDKINVSIQGAIEYEHISYFKRLSDKINHRNEGTFNLKGLIEFDEEASFEIEIDSREDLQDDFRRRLLYVREAYFHFVDRRWDVKAGKQIISWGAADIYSPINGINPIDYTDFLDLSDNQLGVWAARGKRFHTHRFSTEVLISPFLPTIAVPNPNARWVVGLPTMMPHPVEVGRLLPIQYQYINLEPGYRDIGIMVGFRNSITLGQWDIAQSFLLNHNSAPDFTVNLERFSETAAHFNLDPIYQRNTWFRNPLLRIYTWY